MGVKIKVDDVVFSVFTENQCFPEGVIQGTVESIITKPSGSTILKLVGMQGTSYRLEMTSKTLSGLKDKVSAYLNQRAINEFADIFNMEKS